MKINLFGIDSCAGALYEGTEQAPKAIREAQLVEMLGGLGFEVEDHGDLLMGRDLPRHNVGPVRNWPAPRMVWEAIDEKASIMFQEGDFSIILGGDCSIEVGTFTAFQKVYGENCHLLVLDGHVDTVAPNGEHCIGAAGMGLWFLTQDQKVWWKGEPVPSSSVSVVGPHTLPEIDFGIGVIPFEEMVDMGQIERLFRNIPDEAKILVHFDVDVLHESIMPAAYSPSKVGLDIEQATRLLTFVLNDPRVKGIEITEFSANKDIDGKSAQTIVNLLCLISERLDR